MNIVRLRPHHLICNMCFKGKGYSEEFTQNFSLIHKALESKEVNIKIVSDCDDICSKCPERHNNTCKKASIATAIDKAYLKILKLKTDQIITCEQLENKIKQLLTLAKFQTACGKCSWYNLNICEPIVRDAISSTTPAS